MPTSPDIDKADGKERERRRGAVPLWLGRAAKPTVGGWAGGAPGAGLRQLLGYLAKGEVRPLLFALAASKPVRGLLIGVGIAGLTFTVVKLAEHDADRDRVRREFAKAKLEAVRGGGSPGDASAEGLVPNEGLLGQLPFVFSATDKVVKVNIPEKPAEKKAAAAEREEPAAKAGGRQDEAVVQDAAAAMAKAQQRLILAKLPSGGRSQGALGGGSFGPNRVVQGGDVFRPFRRDSGKASALPRGAARRGARTIPVRGAKSDRAMGQLKLAKNLSSAGKAAGAGETGSAYNTAAFEQQGAQGSGITGGASGRPSGGAGVGPSGGGGGAGTGAIPDPGDGGPVGGPEVGPEENQTPYQELLDEADDLSGQAGSTRQMGMILIALGLVMMAVGAYLMKTGWATMGTTFYIGAAMLVAGLALLIYGFMQVNQAQGMANKAQDNCDQVRDQYGQTEQGERCSGSVQAKSKNKAWEPPPAEDHKNSVHEDVEAERNATYRSP